MISCPKCNIAYKHFKTGYQFNDILDMLWVDSNDPNDWKYKRRHTVLGLFHQIKKELWAEHLKYCNGGKNEKQDEIAIQIEY